MPQPAPVTGAVAVVVVDHLDAEAAAEQLADRAGPVVGGGCFGPVLGGERDLTDVEGLLGEEGREVEGVDDVVVCIDDQHPVGTDAVAHLEEVAALLCSDFQGISTLVVFWWRHACACTRTGSLRAAPSGWQAGLPGNRAYRPSTATRSVQPTRAAPATQRSRKSIGSSYQDSRAAMRIVSSRPVATEAVAFRRAASVSSNAMSEQPSASCPMTRATTSSMVSPSSALCQ